MNTGLTFQQQRGHTETGPRLKVSSESPEKQGMDPTIRGLIVQLVIHSTTATPVPRWEGLVCGPAGHSNE